MKTLAEINNEIVELKKNLESLQETKQILQLSREYNMYSNQNEAKNRVEGLLEDLANNDCEGSYTCGLAYYSCDYSANGKNFLCVATPEYNRHDKTYYYVDSIKFDHLEVSGETKLEEKE
jgi:hypothetical protein